MAERLEVEGRGGRPWVLAPAVWILVAMCVVACLYDRPPSQPLDTGFDALAGTAWRAVLVDGQPTVAGSEPTAIFSLDEVSGTTGCNGYSGPYRAADGAIEFADLMSTATGCEPPIATVERGFMAALDGASSVSIDSTGRLVIDGRGGAVVFMAVPKPSGS